MGGDEGKVKLSLAGAGFIAQMAHLVNHTENPNAEIVALAELRSRLREKVCRRYDIPRDYPDHKAMLADSTSSLGIKISLIAKRAIRRS
jgi:predicted dehydrogenase